MDISRDLTFIPTNETSSNYDTLRSNLIQTYGFDKDIFEREVDPNKVKLFHSLVEIITPSRRSFIGNETITHTYDRGYKEGQYFADPHSLLYIITKVQDISLFVQVLTESIEELGIIPSNEITDDIKDKAWVAMNTYAQIARCFEMPELIFWLEYHAMRVLDPASFEKSINIQQTCFSRLIPLDILNDRSADKRALKQTEFLLESSKKLKEEIIQATGIVQIESRLKSPWSILRKSRDCRSLHDIQAFRIELAEEVTETYVDSHIINKLHLNGWRVRDDSKDYINSGKNGWKAVKLIVYTPHNIPVEIQIVNKDDMQKNTAAHVQFKNDPDLKNGSIRPSPYVSSKYVKALGELCYFLRGNYNNSNLLSQKTKNTIDQIENDHIIPVRTKRGNNTIFIPSNSNNPIREALKKIHIKVASGTRWVKIIKPKSQNIITDAWESHSSAIFHPFDRFETLNPITRNKSYTLHDILNALNDDQTNFEEIIENFPTLSLDYLLQVKNTLKLYNKQIQRFEHLMHQSGFDLESTWKLEAWNKRLIDLIKDLKRKLETKLIPVQVLEALASQACPNEIKVGILKHYAKELEENIDLIPELYFYNSPQLRKIKFELEHKKWLESFTKETHQKYKNTFGKPQES